MVKGVFSVGKLSGNSGQLIINNASTPPAFLPTDITTLEFWVDASDSGTITQSSGSVSQWDDKSGSGNHLIEVLASEQPTTGTRTVNGLNAIYFDGTESMATNAFSVVLSQPNTIFVVAKRDVTNESYMMDGINSPNRNILYGSGGNFAAFGGWNFISSSAIDTALHIHTVNFNTTASTYWIDATSVKTGNIGTLALGGVKAGARYSTSARMNGVICEMLVYDKLLTTEERNSVETYLADKWGVTL